MIDREASPERPRPARRLDPDALSAALDQLGGISITDLDGRIIHANDAFARMSGYAPGELLGRDHALLNSGTHPPGFFAGLYDALRRGASWRQPVCNRAKDGRLYWVDAMVVPIAGADGEITGFLSFQFDITEAVGLHCRIREQNQLLHDVIEGFPGGVGVLDQNHRVVLFNSELQRLLAIPREIATDAPFEIERLFRHEAARGEYGAGPVEDLVAARVADLQCLDGAASEIKRRSGRYLERRAAPLAGNGKVVTFVDITARKKDQSTIAKLAQFDSLTGLYNRRVLTERLEQGLAGIDRGGRLALMFIDVDRFKSVNDILGHPVGDQLIKAVASRLKSITRATDTVGRLGGDEFAIVMGSCKDARAAEALARRLIPRLSEPYRIGEHTIEIGASIGIALAPDDGREVDEIMSRADLALYRAKGDGRNCYRFFAREMDERIRARHRIEEGLREALMMKALQVHYQPIISAATGRMSGCEALLRWPHPVHGMIPASEFIPVAEDTGLIVPIGAWVLETACREAARWPDHVSVTVNVSAQQFRSRDLNETVLRALGPLPAGRLVIEITESILMQDNRQTLETLEKLRALGVRFALDDFGTGYSSLSYLQSFAFDKIKIDRQFVSNCAADSRARTLLEAMAGIGKALGITTVAEGVETREVLDHLLALGCEEAQGYLFSAAVPGPAIDGMIDKVWFEGAEALRRKSRRRRPCSRRGGFQRSVVEVPTSRKPVADPDAEPCRNS